MRADRSTAHSTPPAAPQPVGAGPGVVPSPEQAAVIGHRGGHLQVIACAGSGKTEAIAGRIAALVAEGVEPAQVVAFTFTQRAAASLKSRVLRRVAARQGAAFLDRM